MGGTDNDDTIIGSIGDDTLFGDAGNDRMEGGAGNDQFFGGDDDDIITDIFGDDIFRTGAGHDAVHAGQGADLVVTKAGQDFIVLGEDSVDEAFAGEGNDFILGSKTTEQSMGGGGNDRVFGGDGDDDDRVIATDDDGNDVYWGEDGQDTLDYSAITADLSIDLGNGMLQHGSVTSDASGSDTIFGFENAIGGSGNDTIADSSVANVMDGGSGNDSFSFGSAEDADGDTIVGFQPGDMIDLSGIDADAGTDGAQSFVLFAGSGFTAAGQVMVTHETREDGEHTLVMGNTTGGADADFIIDLVGNHNLSASDFNGVG